MTQRDGSATIELLGLSKAFESTTVLQPTDLIIPARQTTVLIGPSGSGKSTVLRLIVGLTSPDGGSVRIGGTELTAENALTLRKRIGYVIQDGGLFPHLTARGNVALMPNYLGWNRTRTEQRIADLAALTQFPREGLDRFPAQLSGGQKQRVALMRALVLDPEVILLDEPLAALDPIIRVELQSDLREIFRRLDKTVVWVTHDIAEAAYFGDRIVLLRDGRIVQQGTLRELVDTPSEPFVAQFIRAQRMPLAELAGGTT